MKFPNYLTSTLAVVGAFSLIIMACSADSSKSATPTASTPPTTVTTSTIGKYQISGTAVPYGTTGIIRRYFDVIDTETGIVKSYYCDPNTGQYTLINTTVTQ
jgi:hypothetical protein